MGTVVDLCLYGLCIGSVYALIGLGFTIIHSVTRIINFSQGEFVMLGSMLFFSFLLRLTLPIAVAFPVTVVGVALVGLLLERLAIRPARNAPVISLIIITIGAAIFIRGIAGQVWGRDPVAIPPFSGDEPVRLFGTWLNSQYLWVWGTLLIVLALLNALFSYTMLGKALRASSISPRAASLVGVNVRTMALISFVLAGALGAIGGAVIAPITHPAYNVGVMLGLWGFVSAAVGGFSSYGLTVAGGLFLGLVLSLTAGLFSSEWKNVIGVGMLYVVLLVRAGGFFGRGEAADET